MLENTYFIKLQNKTKKKMLVMGDIYIYCFVYNTR